MKERGNRRRGPGWLCVMVVSFTACAPRSAAEVQAQSAPTLIAGWPTHP